MYSEGLSTPAFSSPPSTSYSKDAKQPRPSARRHDNRVTNVESLPLAVNCTSPNQKILKVQPRLNRDCLTNTRIVRRPTTRFDWITPAKAQVSKLTLRISQCVNTDLWREDMREHDAKMRQRHQKHGALRDTTAKQAEIYIELHPTIFTITVIKVVKK